MLFIKNYFNNCLKIYFIKYIAKYQQLSKLHKSMVVGCGILIIIFFGARVFSFFNNLKTNVANSFIVATSQVLQKDIQVNVYASGTVQPLTSIAVKSQIDGVILKSFFKEGQLVHKDQLLFEIDPSTAQALYDQAIANLARDQSILQNARLQLQKSKKLYKNKFVSDQAYQQAIANFEVAESTVKASESIMDAAKIQLGFTKIYSPITGFIGQSLVNPGNTIKSIAGASLVNINQVNPIYVLFAIPETNLPELIKNINNLENLTIKLNNNLDSKIDPKIGTLTFMDHQVNNLNGMIMLKSEFCNCDLSLWPGQFVNVALTIKKLSNALVVPNRAVQIGQQGAYLYIAETFKKNNKHLAKVKKTLVKVGPVVQDDTVILEGLQAAQTVITEGHSHLADGDLVEIDPNLL